MKFLECLALLEFQLKKLKSDSREQVSFAAMDDVKNVTLQLQKKMENIASTPIRIRLNDLCVAIGEVDKMSHMGVLSDACKTALVAGTQELLGEIRMAAFEYYKMNDFDETPEIIAIMRGVVEEALRRKKI